MAKVFVCKVDELPEGKMRYVESNGKEILVANVDGKFYAVSDICTHAGANLHEGRLNGKELTCPWHNAVWDVTNGSLIKFPVDLKPLESYKVSVEEGSIYVEV